MIDNPPIAVLTGDLIGSTRLSQTSLSDVHVRLSDAVEKMGASWPAFGPVHFSTFRGDAWQLITKDAGCALRAAMFLRASLRSMPFTRTDTRIAIAIADTPLPPAETVTISTGEAFTLSGHTLDGMKKETLAIALPERLNAEQQWLRALVFACGELISGWTPRQSEVNALALLRKTLTQAELADMLCPPVKQQTIADSFGGSRWNIVDAALQSFEETDWNGLFSTSKG